MFKYVEFKIYICGWKSMPERNEKLRSHKIKKKDRELKLEMSWSKN